MKRRLHNGHVLGTAAFLAPGLALFAPLAMAPLMALAAVTAAVLHRTRAGSWPIPRHGVAGAIVLLLAWAAASLAWDIEAKTVAAWGLARLAFMVLCALVLVEAAAALAPAERRPLFRLLVAGLAVAVVAMAAEQALGYPLRRSLSPEMLSPNTVIQSFNRGMTVVSLVAFPAILLLWRWRRSAALAAWLATAAVIVASPNGSAVLGIVAGTAAAALAYAAPRAAPRILAVVAALLVLGAPFAARTVPSAAEMPVESSAIPGPAHHRLMIWRFTAERIFDRPILGWGYDSSRVIPGREFSFGPGEPALPLHPHNVPLQWWLELGAPGAALGAALLAAIALTIGGRLPGRSERAAALGLFAAALAPACLSYGAWQGWWIGTLGLSAAFMAAAAAFPVWNGSKKA